MAKDAKTAATTLKPLLAKMPKKVPPYLQQDWTKLLTAAVKSLAALDQAVEPADVVKARTDFTTKKNELKALKTKVNDAVTKSKTAIATARAAQAEVMTLGNSLQAIVKDKQNEAGAKAVQTALTAYLPAAMKEFAAIEASATLDD